MKEIAYIQGFSKGSYGNAAANNVPEGYAVYTENTDPKFSDRLAPTRASSALANAADLDAEVLRCTNFDGVKVWGWKASNRALRAYDIATNALGSSLTTTASQTLQSISNINRELYLPMYTTSTKEAATTLWAGLIGHGQFGSSAPSGYELDEARCDSLTLSKSLTDNYPDMGAKVTCNEDSVNYAISNDTTSHAWAFVAPPVNSAFLGNTLTGDDGFFSKAKNYYWAVSLVYDGYQESPLIKGVWFERTQSAATTKWRMFSSSASSVARTENYVSCTLAIYVNIGTSTTFSKRITGVNLYRAEVNGLLTSRFEPPTTQYRFVKSFSIRTGSLSPEVVASAGVPVAQTTAAMPTNISSNTTYNYTRATGTMYRINFTDTGFEGATYEENTGVFETLEQNWVDYRLSAFANGYHFVGRCAGAPTLLGARKDNVIFRSAPNAPAVFNIAKDFLQLPDTPTALVPWNGRLYAFSETRFMRINPEAMFIEEEILGFGAIGDETAVSAIGVSRLVTPTPYGLFFADLNNIYMYNGQSIVPIGDAITRQSYAGDLGWIAGTSAGIDRRRQATMVFDPYSQRVLIFYKSASAGDTQQYYLSYDPVRQRWDYGKPSGSPWTAGSVKAADFDSKGQLYTSLSSTDWAAADVLHTMFTGADEAMTLVTPAYDFGSLKQTKWFYDVIIKNAGPVGTAADIDYRLEETASWTTSAPVTTSGVLSSIDLNKALGRVLQIRVTVASGGNNGKNSIDNLSVQFRRKLMKE